MRICEDIWRQRLSSFRRQEAVAFSGDALVLGCGTVLLKAAEDAPTALTLRTEAEHDRMVALLVVAGRGHLARPALLQLDAVLDEWRRGHRALAAMRLAFARLPRVRDLDEAHTLFLAETALDAGLSANDLLKELGYADGLPLLKFDPNQPRVPAGSGARSGQWTSDAPGVSFAPTPAPAAPSGRGGNDLRPIPVFLPTEGEDSDARDKPRRLLDESVEERIREGRPLTHEVPGGFEIEPAPELTPEVPAPKAPSVGVTDPDVPQTGPVPVPIPIPIPGGDGPGGGNGPRDDGPACPAPKNDRPRGKNENADAFEYRMSLIVNPLNPTPKQNPEDPTTTSMAYYLATSTPDGKTSYDDCKKDDTPITIPGVRRGDMFEFKSENFGWMLYYNDSEAYEDFVLQVKRQNEGVVAEGLGRRVFYCLGTQALADRANRLLTASFPNSRFLKCD